MKKTLPLGLGNLAAAGAALVATIVLAEASLAATPKKPVDPNCQKWELRTAAKGNWTGVPTGQWWLCVAGDNKGATVGSKSSGTHSPVPVPVVVVTYYPGNSGDHRNDVNAQRGSNNGHGWNGTGTLNGNKTGWE